MYIIGVDIGLSGGISLLSDKSLLDCEPMPVIETKINNKMRNIYDIKQIIDIIKSWNEDNTISMAIMERLRPIPKQASQVGFSLGFGAGMFKTILTSLGIAFMEIEPHKWQKKIFGDLGIQYSQKTTKQASIQAAKQLFPAFDFRPTERCKNYSDGMTDSALIGYYLFKI